MTAKTLAALIALSLLLAGCGNKGSLVLPPASMTEAPPLEAPEDATPVDDASDAGASTEATDADENDDADADADTPPPVPGA